MQRPNFAKGSLGSMLLHQQSKNNEVHKQSQTSQEKRNIPCLFTKHLTKKRKTWNDGILNVNISNCHGSSYCSLYEEGREKSKYSFNYYHEISATSAS